MAFSQRACVYGSKFSFRIAVNNWSVTWYYYLGIAKRTSDVMTQTQANKLE